MSTDIVSDQQQVPLGHGPPTKEELALYYPPKFTWPQLKLFINSGYDLAFPLIDFILTIPSSTMYQLWESV